MCANHYATTLTWPKNVSHPIQVGIAGHPSDTYKAAQAQVCQTFWFMCKWIYFCIQNAEIKVKYMLLNEVFLRAEITRMINELTCFGFAGSSVGLQAEAICASASVRSLRVHTDLTACPVISAFITICGKQRVYLLNAKYVQTWPKYINPTLNVAMQWKLTKCMNMEMRAVGVKRVVGKSLVNSVIYYETCLLVIT